MNTEIKNMWRKKSWSIPDLLGSKSEYTKIVIGLIQQIASGNANGMDDFPKLEGVFEPRTWREYVPFLKGIGIVGNHNGSLCLSETGEWLHRNLSFYNIASVMQERFRIFAKVFRYMGFEAKRVGGPGNTDVVVRWIDDEGKKVTAIVDAKSKSSGQVSHNDVSDVAIDAHKEKNNADYVAIVGAGFSGDTIKNFASRKKVALITDQELIDIAKKAEELGLNLQEIAIIFQSPDGKSRLQELISTKQREQNLIELIVATFRKEQEMLESISARDMFLLLRMTDNSPSLEEILNVFSLLSTDEIDVLEMNKQASAKENTTYTMKNAKATVNRLKMIANAIEKGIEK